MVEFRATLTAEGVSRLHGAISCLAKFHEVLGIDISPDDLTLVALNSTKTSSASVTLSGPVFFRSFHFKPPAILSSSSASSSLPSQQQQQQQQPRFQCQLFNRSLLSVFKTKSSGGSSSLNSGPSSTVSGGGGAGGGANGPSSLSGPSGGGGASHEGGLERCELSLFDRPDRASCRLVVSMTSLSGVRKQYRLTYEASAVPRAVLDRAACTSSWAMGARALRGFADYFGARTELLDVYHDGGRVALTSYTDRVMRGSEVLRQPLQTTVDVDARDFLHLRADERVHVGISVRDFRAIVAHADALRATVEVEYGAPRRCPMRIAYEEHGLACEFVLATTGQYQDGGDAAAGAGSARTTPAPANARRAGSAAPTASRPMQPVMLDKRPLPPVNVREPAAKRQHTGDGGMVPQSLASSGRQPSEMTTTTTTTMMPPPSRSPSVKALRQEMTVRTAPPLPRPLPRAPSASVDEQSLFVTDDDDDEARWDEATYDAEEDQLGWNDSYAPDQLRTLTQASSVAARSNNQTTSEHGPLTEANEIPPTQPMNDMRGLFD